MEISAGAITGPIRKNPMRPLTDQERQLLEQLTHARSERAEVMTYAMELLAVTAGQIDVLAAAITGRCSDHASLSYRHC